MLNGTIIENSLHDTSILGSLTILRSWKAGAWKLHQVHVNREQALQLARYLADGPWYMHFWDQRKDAVLVVFKDKIFDIKYSDTSTWKEVLQYGKSLHIPEKQLTFVVH